MNVINNDLSCGTSGSLVIQNIGMGIVFDIKQNV